MHEFDTFRLRKIRKNWLTKKVMDEWKKLSR